jgi:hypothetical protein
MLHCPFHSYQYIPQNPRWMEQYVFKEGNYFCFQDWFEHILQNTLIVWS